MCAKPKKSLILPFYPPNLVYVTSYIREYDEDATSSSTLSIFSSSLFFQAIFMPVGGLLEMSYGPRTTG